MLTFTSRNGSPVPYYLDEDKGWSMSVPALKTALAKARGNGVDVKCLVVINPGNPTGQVLSYENIADTIRFCHQERLLICADEVYQENIYVQDKMFHSFRCVLIHEYMNLVVTEYMIVAY